VLWIQICIDFGRLDPDPGWQKCSAKVEKSKEISCFEVLNLLFYCELKASLVAWTSFVEA
jgi:hypothetical protein